MAGDPVAGLHRHVQHVVHLAAVAVPRKQVVQRSRHPLSDLGRESARRGVHGLLEHNVLAHDLLRRIPRDRTRSPHPRPASRQERPERIPRQPLRRHTTRDRPVRCVAAGRGASSRWDPPVMPATVWRSRRVASTLRRWRRSGSRCSGTRAVRRVTRGASAVGEPSRAGSTLLQHFTHRREQVFHLERLSQCPRGACALG